MTASRRSHQCSKAGCDSEARWQLFVRFVTTTPKGNLIPMTGESTIKVCDRHREAACESFLSERNLDAFAIGLAKENLGVPHPANIQFEFAEIKRPSAPLEINSMIAQCDRTGCVNPAKWQIVLKLWAIGQTKARHEPSKALISLCVCQRHRQESTVKNVLSQEAKSKLTVQLAERGFPMPDFRLAELEFIEVKDGRKTEPSKFAAVVDGVA